MKKMLLLIVMFAGLSFSSCTKTASSSGIQPGVVFSFYAFPQLKTDGSFLISAQVNNNPIVKNTADIVGSFIDKNGNVNDSSGVVSIGPYHIHPNIEGYYYLLHLNTDSLYGFNLTFTLAPPPNTVASPVIADFYFPAAIYITNNTVIPAIKDLKSDSNLLITWNEDPKNRNGVNIYAQFLGTDSLIMAGYPIAVEKSLMVDDTGSTLVPSSFFSDFPKGVPISLFVGRGNAMVVQSGNYRYYLGGFINAMEPVVITN